ncbi:MAG: ABC transporter permease [bacterium]
MLNSFSFAIKSLRSHKLRTALAMLAVSIGIAAVITVVSSGEGLRFLINSQIETFGTNLIQIEVKIPGAKKNSTENAMEMAAGITITTLKDEDREAILKEFPQYIEGAYSGFMGQEQIVRQEKRKKTMIFGTSAGVIDVDNMEIEQGRMYTENEERSMARVAVLGSDIKEKLFGKEDPIGQSIKIKGKQFKVVGTLKSRGGMAFFNFDEMLYIPLKTLQKQISGVDYVSFISVKAKSGVDLDRATSEIADILRIRHSIDDPQKDDFSVTTMEEAMESVGTILDAVEILLLGIAAISLLVGGVGIMNVMYVNVKERTFEIGLRKALGASPRSILAQFLWEALLVSLLGAVLGIAGAAVLSAGIAKFAISKHFSWKFTIPIISIILAVGFSMAVGLLFGFLPAKSASKKDAVEALRG